jgi:hypothetical protein
MRPVLASNARCMLAGAAVALALVGYMAVAGVCAMVAGALLLLDGPA